MKVRFGVNGGEGGIRTHGTCEGTTDFESVPFGHSGTSPTAGIVTSICVRLLLQRPYGDESLERVAGIEPVSSAWEAEVLPLNYTRTIPHEALSSV